MSSGKQETPAVDSRDRRETLEAPTISTKLNEERRAECNGVKSTADELLPWLVEFKNKCRCSLAQRSLDALTCLMEFYERNIVVNVSECYTKPYRAAKLKDSISETLFFFLFYYRELVEVVDRALYLDKMSDILAMYMDMELKASRRGKEHHGKIAARLASTLYIYLENSPEHILDTFMKARFVNRNYHDILDPLITKILKTTPPSPNSDVSYVRYLLIYRLWKRVNIDATVKNEINGTAISNLGPPPNNLAPFLAKHVLPKIPKSQSNSTKFLLLHKFDIEKACRLFVRYCKLSREDNERTNGDKINFTGSTANNDALEALGGNGICRGTIRMENRTSNVNVSGVEKNRLSSLKDSSGNEQLPTRVEAAESSLAGEKSGKNVEAKENNCSGTSMKPIKALPRSKMRKNGEILLIDLTSEEVKEKVIKKKKRRKLEWLVQARRKISEINAKKRLKNARTVPKMANSTSESGSSPRSAAGSSANETTAMTSSTDDPISVAIKEQEIISNTDERTDNSGELSNICDDIRASYDGDSVVDRSPKNTPGSTLPLEMHDQEVPSIGAELVLGNDNDDDDDDDDDDAAALSSNLDGIVAKISDNSRDFTIIQSEIAKSDSPRVDSSTSERKIPEKDLKSARDLHDLVSRTNDLNLDATATINASESIDFENKINDRRSSSRADPKVSLDANRCDETATERFAGKRTGKPEENNDRLSEIEATSSLKSKRGKSREAKSGVRQNATRRKSVANRNAFSKDDSGNTKTILKDSSNSTRTDDPGATEIVAKTYKPSDLLRHREVNFGENIDGLSLLASVSQHVLNLKAAEKKSASPGQIPVEEDRRRRCSRKSVENSGISEEIGTDDSCEPSLDTNAIASSELINEIVALPPKVHRGSESIPTSRKIQASDTAPGKFSVSGESRGIESVVAESSMVRYAVGSGTSDEIASQATKESRNVILDGETVVLLKKSANSNLYIINKSLDGSGSRFVGETGNAASSVPATAADKTYEKYSPASKNTFNALRDIKNVVERRAGESKRGKRSLKSREDVAGNVYEARYNENHRRDVEPTNIVDVRRFEDQHEDASLPESDGLSKSSRTDTPESVIEMEPRKKTPPPIIRLTDTPFEDRAEQRPTRRDSPSKLGGSFQISNRSHEAGGELALWNSYAAKSLDRDKQPVGIKQEFVNGTDDDAFPEFYAARYDEPFLDFETRSMRAAQILPPKIPPSYVYGATNLFAIQRGEFVRHPHVGCNLQVSTSHSRQNFQLPCACLDCGYDARYRRQVQQVPAIITAAPCLQTNSFLVPTASPLVPCPMQDTRNSKLDEIAIAKLSDDQLLRNIEQSITTSAGERGGTRRCDAVEASKYKPEVPDIKLPLKKRLKAHALMALSNETPIKLEKMDNYPGTPMMSIAALETAGDPGTMIEDPPREQKCYTGNVEARIKDDHHPSAHHATSSTTTEMIRRDYVKEASSVGIVDEKTSSRKAGEQQRKQPSALAHESNFQRTFKTPAQRKELFVPSPASLAVGIVAPKRAATSPIRAKSSKKAKKAKSPAKPRQTRSSKRNIPKVNYSFSDADTEWTNTGDLTRKRKKTSR